MTSEFSGPTVYIAMFGALIGLIKLGLYVFVEFFKSCKESKCNAFGNCCSFDTVMKNENSPIIALPDLKKKVEIKTNEQSV